MAEPWYEKFKQQSAEVQDDIRARAGQITASLPRDPGAPPNMAALLGLKYATGMQEAAGKVLQQGSDANTLPGLREAQSFHLRAAGQESLERAATEATVASPDWLRGAYRQLNETRQLPLTLPTPGATPGAGAPGAEAPGAGTAAPAAPTAERPSIQFHTLPAQPDYAPLPRTPAITDITPATPTIAPAPAPTSSTSPQTQLQTPEQLSQAALNAAARRRTQETVLPSLIRPAGSARVGLRRGTANVQRQGYAEGDADILLKRPLFGTQPNPGGGRGESAGTPSPAGNLAPAPALAPTPGPLPSPYAPDPAPDNMMASPAPSAPVGPARGIPWDPNAMTGMENLGGIVNAGLQLFDPEKFHQTVQSMPLSGNVEDRRGDGPPGFFGTVRGVGEHIAGGGQALASDVWRAIVGDTPTPGGLGSDGILGPPSPGIVGTLSSIFGSSTPAAAAPAEAPVSSPSFDSPSGDYFGYKKGTANVGGKGSKGSKGSKGGKGGKAGPSDGLPKGLEALLPLLMAMHGGGAAPAEAGPPPAGPPPAGPPPAQGFKKGSTNVKGKSKGAAGEPTALEALLPALLAASRGGGAAGPPAVDGLPPGAGAPPGFARGGYLDGETTVPGQGSGMTDTVPAMLAPHEAVLNRAAADMLGRGLIAALNAQGVKNMGMHRGATARAS